MKILVFLTLCAIGGTAVASSEPVSSTSSVNSGIISETSHSGRTDKSGCHENTKTGTRHCH